MATDYYKYHALGNDYIVIDPGRTGIDLTAEAVRLICHRHYGVGSDGILYGPLPGEDGITLRIYNPDGSEAEKSGNGLRIFARYLMDAGYVKGGCFPVHTPGGTVGIEILDDRAGRIRVDMGTHTFRSQLIPVRGEPREVVDEPLELDGQVIKMTCVSVGNPHCVVPVAGASPEHAMRLGPSIECHTAFPNRTNVQFLEVLDEKNLRIEIWERGAGYTLASGSSSCAAACAARRLGLAGEEVTVHMPGGTLEVAITPDGHVHLTGAVSAVARGEFAEEFREGLGGSARLPAAP